MSETNVALVTITTEDGLVYKFHDPELAGRCVAVLNFAEKSCVTVRHNADGSVIGVNLHYVNPLDGTVYVFASGFTLLADLAA